MRPPDAEAVTASARGPVAGPLAGPVRGPAARERPTLLDDLTRTSVASDYAPLDRGSAATSRRQRVLVAAIALGLAGFVLALGLSERVLNDPVINDQRSALQERIAAADVGNDELTEQVATLRDELGAVRDENLVLTQAGTLLATQIANLGLATGYTTVTGPGAQVTLADAALDEGEESQDIERVLDSDVQRAVNGLWAAGAEAIAVNGQRLTAQSAIRSAAGAILVNYRPLKPPYLIEAIGSPELAERFSATPDAAALAEVSTQFGIGFDSTSTDSMTLRSATSPLPTQAQVLGTGQGDR
ncbi:MAG: DUF881 domain-containing protein [Candidatus Nanopelagicales bacterium]